jgi:lipoate-protein ligase B
MPSQAAYLLNLERTPYQPVWELMKSLVDLKVEKGLPSILIQVEHDPVITMGRRGQTSDILIPVEMLEAQGVALHKVERGGLNTYHGPGQLVAYPLFNLKELGLSLTDLVKRLEQVIIQTVARFGIEAHRQKGHPGVWFGMDKIASLGLAVRRNISYHGIALNVDPNLQHFGLINPCGIEASRITSLAKLSGKPVDFEKVRDAFANEVEDVFGLKMHNWSLAEAKRALQEAAAG